MVGPQRRFCKLDGSWSGFQPQCLNPKAGILNKSDYCNSILIDETRRFVNKLIIEFLYHKLCCVLQVLSTIVPLIRKHFVAGLRTPRTRPSDGGH